MARGSGKRNQIVPEAHKALDALKYEIAAELGLPVGINRMQMAGADAEFAGELGDAAAYAQGSKEDYWGYISARDAGAVGGHITRRLIASAEKDLFSL